VSGQCGEGLDSAWPEGSYLGMQPGETVDIAPVITEEALGYEMRLAELSAYASQLEDALDDAERAVEALTPPPAPAVTPLLPTDSKARKEMPIYSGVVAYFPRSLGAIAQLSFESNEKHNPGEPLHWSKDKSNDHRDCIMRHLIEAGTRDPDDGFLHDVKLAWRALANLETVLERMEEDRS
jgi:hypothetical protein